MKSMLFMIVIAGMLFAAISAMAAVPPMLNFQGNLTDIAGVPIANDTKSVLFRIWDASAGGSVKWFETQNIITDGNGNFSVLLDTVFNQPDRWLGIKVDTDPEISPRAKLVSIGYSFRVSTIDEARGGHVNGNINLDNSSLSTGNILKDGTLFVHNFGSLNTFVGEDAGNLSMSGGYNASFGFEALRSNTSGGNNVAFGAGALTNNTSGENNTAYGADALWTNTTATDNTAVGISALFSNTSGFNNTAIGSGALVFNNTGDGNTAVGSSALQSNTTGTSNTASGFGALRDNSVGVSNTAAGDLALRDNDGSFNTAFGASALQRNLNNSSNTAIGAEALFENTTGAFNAAGGRIALRANTTGKLNTAFGFAALDNNSTGSNNTAIGAGADVSKVDLTNATAIGNDAIVDASNKIRLGNTAVTIIEGQVAYTFSSDKNLKEYFRAVDGNEVLKKIRDFDLTSWNYIGKDYKKIRHYGPMAQDFFAAFGNDGVGTIGSETTINTGDLAGILMIAVQTLSKENEQMRSQNADLDARLKALETQLKKLSEKKLASR